MKKSENAVNIRYRLCCVLMGFFILIIFCAIMPLLVRATEKEGAQEAARVQGKLMEAAVDTVGLERPEKDAVSVVELQTGTHLFVVGEETNGWCEIYYQGKTAFVPAAVLKEAASLETEVLEQEMQKIGEEGSSFIESLEMQRKAIARSKVWRIIIIVLIAAVFVTGVVSALRKPKNDERTLNKKNIQGK